jgi:hypothetical protein
MTPVTTEYKIIAQERKEGILTATLLSNGVVEIVFSSDLTLIDTEHLEILKDCLGKLGGGKRLPLYFSIAPFLNISSEGRKYSASDSAGDYTLANAVLVGNLAQKIAFNFFVTFNKPPISIKAFSTKEEAFEWLLSIKG